MEKKICKNVQAFEAWVLPEAQQKNIKGGDDFIGIEDAVNG